jgi:hypothetical protein
MTNQHPLTVEISREIGGYLELDWMYSKEYMRMRAAADWQLEQVIKWLKDHTAEYVYEDYYGGCFNEDGWLDDLRKAMRPT